MKKIISLLTALMLVLCILPATAMAAEITASGTCGDSLTWTLDSEGTLTISGTGEMTDVSGWSELSDSVTSVVIEEGVTSIASGAFYCFKGITSLTIPETVTTIGNTAFYLCKGLESLVIPGSVTQIGSNAFYGCSGLTEVMLSEGLVCIENGGFAWCSALAQIKLPATLTSVSGSAFSHCLALQRIQVDESNPYYSTDEQGALLNRDQTELVRCPGALSSYIIAPTVTSIGAHAFEDCRYLAQISIPEGITTIGNNAFSHCDALAELVIPDTVTNIGHSAFYNCNNLVSITLPEGICTIESTAFSYCKSLTHIDLPASISRIKSYAFAYCTALEEITIPVGVTVIDNYAFQGDSQLTQITFCGDAPSIGSNAFQGVTASARYPYDNETWTADALQMYGGTITWGSSLLDSGDCGDQLTWTLSGEGNLVITGAGAMWDYGTADASAPWDTAAVKRLIVGEGVTDIGNWAFAGCEKLTEVVLPDTVTTLGSNAFRGCTGLKKISLPTALSDLGNHTFYGCTGLTAVAIPETIMDVDSNTFYGCTGLTTVTLPSQLTTIGDDAFYGCKSLTNVILPSTLTNVGTNAFSGCTGLTLLILPSALTAIGEEAFSNCESLGEVIFKGAAPTIGENAFYGAPAVLRYNGSSWTEDVMADHGGTVTWKQYNGFCGDDLVWTVEGDLLTVSGIGAIWDCPFYEGYVSSWDDATGEIGYLTWWKDYRKTITKAVIGHGVTGIGSRVFYDCSALTDITISDTVTDIDYTAFWECESLTGIWADENNPCYSSDEYGVLYNKEHTVLVCAPGAIRSYSIPEGVTAVAQYAFADCDKLTDITMANTVAGLGNSAFVNCDLLTNVTLSDQLTEVGHSAFYGCKSLAQITLPQGLTSLSNNVFCDCTGLTKVILPDGLTSLGSTVFENCTGLTEILLPDTLTTMGTSAFEGCESLTSITIPDSLITINDDAFLGCKALTQVVLPEGVKNIYDSAFAGCSSLKQITLPGTLKYIGECAFSGCSGLSGITIPDGVTVLNPSAFRYCTALTEVVLPSQLKTIENRVFLNCTNLKEITIPDTVTTIGDLAFQDCKSLTKIHIPAGVTAIGSGNWSNNVFVGCSALQGIWVHEDNTVYSSDEFGAMYNNSMTRLLAVPGATERYTIEEGVTSIAKYAFSGCSALTEVMIPDSVTSIGNEAFEDCVSLTAVTIPEGVTYIYKNTFRNCSSLTSVRLPSAVTTVCTGAFTGCENLQTIHFSGNAPTIQSYAFTNVTATVCYPCKNDTWTEDLLQNYGGTLTWQKAHSYEGGSCAICGEADPNASVKPTLTLKYPTVAFEDEVILNVYFDAADLQDTVEMGLLTFTAQPETVSADTAATVTPGYSFSETEQLYLVTSNGIAAKDLGDTIYLTVYAKLSDGSYVYTPVASYSPQTYAYNLLETGSEEMQSMVVSMLNYGAAAQSYFGSEEALVNGKLTETQLAMAESYRSDMMSPVVAVDEQKTEAFTKTGGFTTGYPTVSFEGAFSINYYFTPANTVASDVQLYYWTADDYSAAEALTAENASGILTMEAPIARTATGYQAAVENIAAKDLDDTVYVACVYSDGTTQYCSGVLAYSIGAYCSAQAAKTGTLADLAAATAVYGYYAKQLFG